MTGRDRIVLTVIVVMAVLAGGWLLVVSPERKQATKVTAEVEKAKSELSSAEGQLASARTAQTQYAAAYASIVSLGKAVPATQEVPSLIDQISQATNEKDIEFSSIVAGGGSSSSSSAASAASSAGFTAMPFTFVVNGSFSDLEHLFANVDGFATRTPSGTVAVSGRLLTVQGVKLAPTTSPDGSDTKDLSGTITATAYQLPASQGVTGVATAASPTGATGTVASTTGAASSPTAPAIARVNP
jgi:Tfp pilus assembly protein PilO